MLFRYFFTFSLALAASAFAAEPAAILEKRCYDCHDSETHKGNLDLTALKPAFTDLDAFAKWVKVYDRIEAGEMPPKKKEQPSAEEKAAVMTWLHDSLLSAEQARLKGKVRTAIHRLTRAEYENTMRDLFDLPGLALSGDLPADGSAHGFDKNSDALDISHVNLAKYIESAEKTLDIAIATRPVAPLVQKRRIPLSCPAGFVAHILLNGDAVLLKDKKIDPEFPPAGEEGHLDQGAHERMGSYNHGATVGLFRHEDESVSPYFSDHVTIYPGMYRVRTSLWSFQWDKGQVLPSRGTEAARLSVVQLTGDGRGGQHPSYVLGYYDAPSMESKEHELMTWLNVNEQIGFNTASLAPVANYARKGHAMAFTGPAIACDWLEVEGPLHEQWPPKSHELLFGKLPLAEFKKPEHPGVKPPARVIIRQIGAGKNRRDPEPGLWTVQSENPIDDANKLLADFLPKAFRHPVDVQTRMRFVSLAKGRLEAGDCFETAMRYAYRAALCAPEFLYHIETPGPLDDYAFASRLSYFFWNSMPDARLRRLAGDGTLRKPEVLKSEVERMLKDAKSQRFVEDFLGQWLKLRSIAANDPDRKLYPEFNPYLQDSMVAETRAYFRELIDQNLDATYLVKSDFAMLNQKLATHYGIPGVTGAQVHRVALPPGCPRGGFLTQAAILKVTANGTTTSPVPRGAFVMARLLGEPPEPPPANTPAVEPDVRGAVTIREQLEKHRADASCAGCHAKIDPAGFALEAIDVIGGYRTRYRSLENGDPAPRGSIDPFIGIQFKLGPAVDATGALPDGRKFHDIIELENILASHPERLLRNLLEQLAIYSTGRDVTFGDREQIAGIIARTQQQGGGLRTLIHELVQSELFAIR
jgi:hypothetical protein